MRATSRHASLAASKNSHPVSGRGGAAGLRPKLRLFIRLWRKLRESRCFCYSFAELRDICDVLLLSHRWRAEPGFIRQLAAFEMLRDHLRHSSLRPREPSAGGGRCRSDRDPGAVGRPVGREMGLGDQAADPRVAAYALWRLDPPDHRSAEFVDLLASNLDPLSQLAGFDPSSLPAWHALPTHTLRFAEILAKIYASVSPSKCFSTSSPPTRTSMAAIRSPCRRRVRHSIARLACRTTNRSFPCGICAGRARGACGFMTTRFIPGLGNESKPHCRPTSAPR